MYTRVRGKQARDGFDAREATGRNPENPGSAKDDYGDVPGKSKSPISVTRSVPSLADRTILSTNRTSSPFSLLSCVSLLRLLRSDPIYSGKCHRLAAPSIIPPSRTRRDIGHPLGRAALFSPSIKNFLLIVGKPVYARFCLCLLYFVLEKNCVLLYFISIVLGIIYTHTNTIFVGFMCIAIVIMPIGSKDGINY